VENARFDAGYFVDGLQMPAELPLFWQNAALTFYKGT